MMKYWYILLIAAFAFSQDDDEGLIKAVNHQILQNENTIILLESQIDSTKSLINEIRASNFELRKKRTRLNALGGSQDSAMVKVSIQSSLKIRPTPFAENIGTIPRGTELVVYYDLKAGIYLSVRYGEDYGYVGLGGFSKDSFPQSLLDYIEFSKIETIKKRDARRLLSDSLREVHENEEYDKREREEAITEKRRLERLASLYGQDVARLILSRQIWIGMTSEMARSSRGYPKDINRTVYSFGTHEQWVYPNGVYLYFENGFLTSWQD